VLVIIGIFAILGSLRHWEIDSLFVTALLTVIGFSTHDTIVIFDRIRENLRHRVKGESFDDLVNRSINQSFARSINTSFTVILTLTALLVFLWGGVTSHFIIALLAGVITGTYSSIFNASQLLVLWQRITGRDVTGRSLAPAKPARVREMKPLVEIPSNGGGADIGSAASQDELDAAAAKAKAKKRKRRY